MLDTTSQQQELFARLLHEAAREAEAALARPGEQIRIRALGEDGLTAIDHLEQSPAAEDQFMAMALRLSGGAESRQRIFALLSEHFRIPPPGIAIEAQRRAIWGNNGVNGVPVDRAADIVQALERRLDAAGADVPQSLGAYASLYTDLWCDPRIGAAPSARRLMLAMVTVLHTREQARRASAPKICPVQHQ